MELRIKPFPKNNYPKKGLLIKGSSPLIWLHEMEILGIDLDQIKSFPIPSNEPNIVYGCFLIFTQNAPSEIGKSSYFQCIDDILFIPENTTFYPKINPEDWQNTDAEFLIMHPDFGLVKLAEQIDWISLIQEPEKSTISIRKPSNGVKIPQKIETFTVEMDDEKVLESLQQQKTEEEWMKNLPFDLKKVMAGNKKEIEKYLQYIEKYPDRAVDLGVPLDIMGTSRGDGFGIYKFGDNWFGRLFGKQKSYSIGSVKNYQWILWVFLIVSAIVRSTYESNKDRSQVSTEHSISGKAMKNLPENIFAYQSGVTDIDMKIDSIYGKKRRELMDEHMKASLSLHDSNNKNTYEEYLKKGGKPINKIQDEILSFNDKTEGSRDSLKKVYTIKIEKYILKKSENTKREIADSVQEISSGKLVDEGIVRNVWHKKKVLMADSLGRLYGTLDIPEPKDDKNSNGKTLDNQEKSETEKKVSFSEIIWLIIFMTGAVGLYSFILKRKSMNIGGGNVPIGIKVFLMIVLLAMLVYLFYPLIQSFGYNWFVWILIICVVFLLYRLFAEDKTILKSDDHE